MTAGTAAGSVTVGILVEGRVTSRLRLGNAVEGLKLAMIGAGEAGIRAYVFSPESIKNRDEIYAFTYGEGSWAEIKVSAPTVLYDRAVFPAGEKAAGKQARRMLAEWGCIPINKKAAFSKWRTYQVLSKWSDLRPYLPFTAMYQHPVDFDHFLYLWNIAYLKPVNGRLGKEVIRCERDEAGCLKCSYFTGGRNHLALLKGLPEIEQFISSFGNKKFVLQRGIDLAKVDGCPFDLRVLVQKDGLGQWGCTGIAARKAARGRAVTNISSGGSAMPAEKAVALSLGSQNCEVLELAKKVSLEAAMCLDRRYGPLGELGIDIGLDTAGNPWLFEVNGKPAKSSLRKIGAVEAVGDSYRHPFEFAKYLAASKGSAK